MLRSVPLNQMALIPLWNKLINSSPGRTSRSCVVWSWAMSYTSCQRTCTFMSISHGWFSTHSRHSTARRIGGRSSPTSSSPAATAGSTASPSVWPPIFSGSYQKVSACASLILAWWPEGRTRWSVRHTSSGCLTSVGSLDDSTSSTHPVLKRLRWFEHVGHSGRNDLLHDRFKNFLWPWVSVTRLVFNI